MNKKTHNYISCLVVSRTVLSFLKNSKHNLGEFNDFWLEYLVGHFIYLAIS